MGSRQFTQQEKLRVLKASEEVGIKEAARVDYVTVYVWRRQLVAFAARLAHGALPAPGPHASFSASK